MIIKKCRGCGNDVEVQSKLATKVLCQECREKKGYNEHKQDFDTDEFVYCRICNIAKKYLNAHIKNSHKLTVEQYLEKLPGSPLIAKNTSIAKKNRSQESRDRVSASSKAAWQDPEYREKQINRLRGPKPHWKMSEEGIEHIKDGQNNSVKMQSRRERAKQNEQRRKDDTRREKENLKEFVICPLCLREGKDEIDSRCEFLTFKHLQRHSYSLKLFKHEFPDFKFKTESLSREHSESLSGEKHFNYGKKLSVEIKQNIAIGVSETWDEHNPTKICPQCGARMMERNEKDVCNKCLFKIYGFEDTHEYVHCRICFRINGNLTRHIELDHQMSVEDYKKMFDNCEVLSQIVRAKMATSKLGFIVTEEHKDAMRRYQQENRNDKLILEQNFRREDYDFLLKRKIPIGIVDSYDSIYCRYCLKFVKYITPGHVFHHNLTMWMYRQLFPDAPLVARETVNKVISKGVTTKIREGTMQSKAIGYCGYRKDIGHYTRSMVEANFCRILIFNNVKYEYEPKTFSLEHEKFSSYTPDILLLEDFYVWKAGVFLELKNKALDKENEEKMKIFFEKYPSVPLVVIMRTSQEIVNLERQFRHKIDLWETSEKNINKNPELY